MSTFASIKSKFIEGDARTKRDAADEAFHSWYDVAKSFASGDQTDDEASKLLDSTMFILSLLLGLHGGILKSEDDDWTAEVSLQHGAKIFTIFRVKPKFFAVVKRRASPIAKLNEFWKFTNEKAIRALQFAALSSNDLSWGRRKRILECLQEIVELGAAVARTDEVVYPNESRTLAATFPFSIDLWSLTEVAADTTGEELLRDAAIKVLQATAGEGGVGWAPEAADAILAKARDVKALTPAWNLGALANHQSVNVILRRIEKVRGPGLEDAISLYNVIRDCVPSCLGRSRAIPPVEASKAVPFSLSTLRAQGPLRHHVFIEEILISLYEAIINARTDDTQHYQECRTDTHADSEAAFPGLLVILIQTDIVPHEINSLLYASEIAPDAYAASRNQQLVSYIEERVRLDDDEHRWERHDAWLELARSMLYRFSNHPALLRLLLAHPTMTTINLLNAASESFNEQAWLQILFPFIISRLRLMGEGVSGSQWDEDVVKLLREAIRIFYLAGDVCLSTKYRDEFGFQLFRAILLAISKGYSEQERLAEYGARILRWHAFELSKLNQNEDIAVIQPWVETALSDDVCRASHKNERAVMELFMIALGVESSAWGVEEANDGITEAAATSILRSLATTHTRAAYVFWRELALNHSAFIHSNGLIGLEEFIRSASDRVNETLRIQLRSCGVLDDGSDITKPNKKSQLSENETESLLLLFNDLSSSVGPSHAAVAFDTMLELIVIISMYRGNRASELIAARGLGTSNEATQALCSDACMAAIVDKISSGQEISGSLVKQAQLICGPLTKTALARLLPAQFLTDTQPLVRQAAMQSLVSILNASMLGNQSYASGKDVTSTNGRNAEFERIAHLFQSVKADSALADSLLFASEELAPYLSVVVEKQKKHSQPRVQWHSYVPCSDAKVHELALYQSAAPALSAAAVKAVRMYGSNGAHSNAGLTSSNVPYDVAVISGAVSRLIRGAILSKEGGMQLAIDTIFTDALAEIVRGCPVVCLQRFARSPYGKKAVPVLRRISSAWNEYTHVLRAAPYYVAENNDVSSKSDTSTHHSTGFGTLETKHTEFDSVPPQDVTYPNLTPSVAAEHTEFDSVSLQNATYRNFTPSSVAASAPNVTDTELIYPSYDDMIAYNPLPGYYASADTDSDQQQVATNALNSPEEALSATTLYKNLQQACTDHSWLEAFDYVSQMEKMFTDAYQEFDVKTIVYSTLIPAVEQEYFKRPMEMIANDPNMDTNQADVLFNNTQQILQRIGHLCDVSNSNMPDLLRKFQRTMIQFWLHKNGTIGAREWMRKNGLRHPELCTQIDAYEQRLVNQQRQDCAATDQDSHNVSINANSNEQTMSMANSVQHIFARLPETPTHTLATSAAVPTAPPLDDQQSLWKSVSALQLS